MQQCNNKIKYIRAIFIGIFLFMPLSLSAKNLSVPFTPQSPFGHWVEPWANACEESATTMIDFYYRYYGKKQIKDTKAAEQILRLISIEDNYLGFNKDNNAKEIAEIINLFLPWEAEVILNPSVEEIKKEIDESRPVIMPVFGEPLNNPYYHSEQVDYHVFVISGYNDETQEFITQDPATPEGIDFHYSYDTIMDAMHDFLPNNKTYKGRKVAIFTRQGLTFSADTDGDNDGLSKKEEIKYGSILFFRDSDGDGYLDGTEVRYGYSPTTKEGKPGEGSLVKTIDNPRVYLIKNGQKRHIVSETVFLRRRWKWDDIKIVNEKFLNEEFKIGKPVTN